MKLGTTSWLIGENFPNNARLVVGKADFIELLVYTWNQEWQHKVSRWLDELAGFDLEYSLHLPTDTAANALAAANFFAASGFPLLNMTLHPLPGWQQLRWPELMAMENLTDRVEFHSRYTFDLTHSLLGEPLPEHFHPHIVELHLSGTDGRLDHLPLDVQTLELAKPLFREDLLVCFEIFDTDDALAAVEMVREAFKMENTRKEYNV
ncbi:hypothetical protein JWJ90_21210 [Desulfobulbus rhabdoformis]|uniref:hypothetical protein n=1 Tax=Desulfobulbus rhabdoformis TaxID=34032 RepID=UPI001965D001|nr:hypothetical protein [Desulfobulbus rhabdoformis]MBM9616786.1 hypothetical protein [Desulfobulbus rhabdoformis]